MFTNHSAALFIYLLKMLHYCALLTSIIASVSTFTVAVGKIAYIHYVVAFLLHYFIVVYLWITIQRHTQERFT